tara:strand:+ start:387 stop:1289 length:903 start_codon:yes stop_codon:yes gene_type:complete
MCKSILVTGASGFIGSNLVERLLSDNFRVVGIGRKRFGLLKKDVIEKENFSYHADINEIPKKINIDGIIHLASLIPYNSDLSYDDYYNTNVNYSKSIIDFAKKHNVKFVLYGSTCSVYGDKQRNKIINENIIPEPSDNYGLSKYIAEKLFNIELKNSEIKVLIFRFTSIFGPDDRYGLINKITYLASRNKPIELFYSGRLSRNYLYISDAIEGIIKILAKMKHINNNDIFILGGNQLVQTKELANEIIKLLGSKSKTVLIDDCKAKVWNPKLDISKAQKLLEFNPANFMDGLINYTKSIR